LWPEMGGEVGRVGEGRNIHEEKKTLESGNVIAKGQEVRMQKNGEKNPVCITGYNARESKSGKNRIRSRIREQNRP